MPEKILTAEFSDEMQKSYINYSMSVITARAVPDIRDGLKPVQRRVLYDMSLLGLNADKPHKKSARIVGDAMGKFHPHGDSSIYEALVVLAQDFKKGMALVDGHGNFGSIEGDGAAAMRYTEARLKKFTQEVFLKDLDKDVVDFVPNYDENEKEPEVLPVRIPNFLVNGSDGIAVGMTTSTPSHNLKEVLDVMIYYMEHEDADTETMLRIIRLRNLKKKNSLSFTITAEMRCESNRDLIAIEDAEDFVVATDLSSMMLAQISTDLRRAEVFTELLDEQGSEAYMKPAADFGVAGTTMAYDDLLKKVYASDSILMGLRTADKPFKIVAAATQPIEIGENDQLVLLGEE